jgi:AraC-like DNA-binding protein
MINKEDHLQELNRIKQILRRFVAPPIDIESLASDIWTYYYVRGIPFPVPTISIRRRAYTAIRCHMREQKVLSDYARNQREPRDPRDVRNAAQHLLSHIVNAGEIDQRAFLATCLHAQGVVLESIAEQLNISKAEVSALINSTTEKLRRIIEILQINKDDYL